MHSEINDASPSSISHLVGQRGVLNQVEVALDACQQDGHKFDDALLIGPPGLGKSQVANIIANEMAGGFCEILGQSVKGMSDLNAVLLSVKDKDVLHIDECHQMKKEFQVALYLCIDRRILFVNGGKRIQAIPVENFSLLLSSTDEHCLLQPLRDRMKLTLRFDFYDEDELSQLTFLRASSLGWDVCERVFPQISTRARGTPRLALRLLQSCRRVCRSLGEETITPSHLERACDLEGIDCLGLGPVEKQYLQIVGEGASRLNVIASHLALPARTVSHVTEPFLIRAGLLLKDDRGRRQLTAKAREHLAGEEVLA